MNRLRSRKLWTVLSLILAPAVLPLAALAQEKDQSIASADVNASPIELEKYQVTGTRLTGAAAEGSLSVSQYKIDTDISLQGYSNFGEMLRTKLPQYGGGIGTINDSYGNGGSGQATISLRDLPGSRTLFLVNGRRTNADLNLIPTTAIESIEVLNDGASAVYGSEAVAGVVNIKLKKDFEGLLFTGRYANTTETDLSERRAGLLAGASTENTRLTISYEYTRQNAQMTPDRKVSLPSGDMVSGTSNPGLFTPRFTTAELNALGAGTGGTYTLVPLRWFVNADVTSGLTPGTALPAAFNPSAYVLAPKSLSASQRNAMRDQEEIRLNGLMGGNSPVQYGPNYVYSDLGDLNPGFPYGYYTTAYRPYDRGMFTASLEHDFSKKLTFFAEVLYGKNTSQVELAPAPLGGNVLPATNYFVNAILPGQPATRTFTYGYRPTELGPRITTNEFTSRRAVAGLRGTIAENWKWEIAGMDDHLQLDQVQAGGVLRGLFTDALNSADQASSFNPFGATPLFATSSPVNPDALIQSFAGSAPSQYLYTTRSVDATISGEMFSLPAGSMGLAFGAEYRQETERDVPSLALINGDVFPFNAEPPFSGKRNIKSVYAEASVPIFSAKNSIPAVSDLSVSLAGRGERYSDAGSTGIKPRIAVRWVPIADQLTIRGSFAQGFVAPSLFTLKPGDRGQDFVEVLNPVTGTRTQPEDGVFLIGNPDLKPSKSDTYLIGAVYSPKTVKGLEVGINYYLIKESGIPFESAQYIVSQWAAAGGEDNASNPYGPAAQKSAQNPTGAQVEVMPSGELQVVRNVGPINTGDRRTDGIDLFGTYTFDTSFGHFVAGASWTRVLTFEQEDFPGAGKIDYLGRYWGGGAALENYGFPEWKGNLSLSWKYRAYTASVGYNYTSGYKEVENGDNQVEAFQTFDVRASYRLPWAEIDLVVGANNVFDEAPPFVSSSFENGFDRAVADIRGRMLFVELSKKF